MRGIVLWENPDPTASFVAQTITLSSDDYDLLEIYYMQLPETLFVEKVLKGYSTILSANYGTPSSGPVNVVRKFDRVSQTEYKFGSGTRYYAEKEEINNVFLIPVKIIGYKS